MAIFDEVAQLANGTGVFGWVAAMGMAAKSIWKTNQDAQREVFEQLRGMVEHATATHKQLSLAQQGTIDLLTADVQRAHTDVSQMRDELARGQAAERDCRDKNAQLERKVDELGRQVVSLQNEITSLKGRAA